jgi:hypothetical protein
MCLLCGNRSCRECRCVVAAVLQGVRQQEQHQQAQACLHAMLVGVFAG